jgi:hypothetical protein
MLWTAPPLYMSAMEAGTILLLEICAVHESIHGTINQPKRGLAAIRATGAYAEVGRPAEGMNCLAEAAQIIETTEERVREAELHRSRGIC